MFRSATSLFDVARHWAAERPEQVAYRFLGDGDEETDSLTFAALDLQARELAAALQLRGLEGERVLLALPPGLDFVRCFWACLYGGVVAVPVPPAGRAGGKRLRSLAEDCGAALVLAEAAEGIPDGLPRLTPAELGEIADWALAERWKPPATSPGGISLLQYTSGSTRAPRGVVILERNLLANLESIRQAFCMISGDVVGSWLPHFHDMGLVGGILEPMYAGATAVLMPPLSFLRRPIRWLRLVDRWGVTVSGAPNFGFELCCDRIRAEAVAELDLRPWRVAFCGAETVRGETLERFAAISKEAGFDPGALLPCYGLAEATLLVTANSGEGARDSANLVQAFGGAALAEGTAVLSPSSSSSGSSWMGSSSALPARWLVSCGPPAPGVQVDIVDPETGLPLPENKIGEIRVRGASVAAGYWQAAGASAVAFQPAVFGDGARGLDTGDRGFLHEGNLYVTGRSKDLVIHRGRNFDPADLEWSASQSHRLLHRGRAIAYSETGPATERVVFLLELVSQGGRSGASFDEEELVAIWANVRRRLRDDFELEPWALHLIAPRGLPRTTSGKIRRRQSRMALEAGELLVKASWCAQEDSTEEVLGPDAEVFRSILARRCGLAPDAIDLDAPCSALGLDSLGASEVLHQLERATGVVCGMAEMFQAASVRELCKQLEEERLPQNSMEVLNEVSGRVLEEVRRARDFPLSEGQRSLFFLQQLDPESTAYHLEAAAWIEGQISASELENGLEALCRRHTALRTTFPSLEGHPVQRVAPRGGFDLQVVDGSADSSNELLRRTEGEVQLPFDLAQGPLLRVRLWTGGERSLLLLVVHHLVADLWSLTILWRELAVLCSGNDWDRRLLLAKPATAHYLFSEREERWLAGPEAQAQEQFWRKRLRDSPESQGPNESLTLPTDRPRPLLQSFRGASLGRRLPSALLSRAREFARRAGFTLFVPLLASWHALLGRWSGQQRFFVGSLASGRHRADSASIVGYLVNPFVTTANLCRGESLESYVRRLGPELLSSMAHVRLPFRRLVASLGPKRDASRSPFFQVLFALQTAPGQEGRSAASFLVGDEEDVQDVGPWRIRPASVRRCGAQFDLSLLVAPDGAGVRLEYCSDLFDATTVHRLLDHWQRFLERFLENGTSSGRGMDEGSLLGDGERHQMVVEAADTRVSYENAGPSMVSAWIQQAGRSYPQAVAVRWKSGTLSYEELFQKSGVQAAALRQAGAGPERIVGLALARGPELLIAIVACLQCGAPFLPLDPEDSSARRRRVLEKAAPTVVLHEEDMVGGRGGDENHENQENHEWQSVHAENLAYVLFTSGSSGEPKGVLNRHGGLLNRLLWMQESYDLGPLDRVLQKTPGTFDVSVWELLWPLMVGAELVLAPPGAHRDPECLLRLIRDHEITVVHFVPSVLREVLQEPGAELCSSLRLVVSSGEELTADLAATVFETFGSEVRLENLYGPTEAAIDVSSWRCLPGAPGRPALGRPIANLSMRVLGRAMDLVTPGAVGELFLGGEGLARGYLGDPGRTAETFLPDPFYRHGLGSRLYRTGDRASQAPGGPFHFHGRVDQQVKLRGVRLELGEVESALRQHPNVGDAVAMVRLSGKARRRTGNEGAIAGSSSSGLRRFSGEAGRSQQLVAYFEAAAPVPTVDDLRAFLEKELPVSLLPGILVPLDKLPRTASGKVDRRRLPDPEARRPNLRTHFAAPSTEKEEAICDSWSRVLGVAPVGLDDNFFHLGGDSIRSLQIRSDLEKRGWVASVAQMQRFATPRSLGKVLRPASLRKPSIDEAFMLVAEEDRPRLPATAEDAYPLSRTQSAVIFHAQYEPSSAMYRDILVCRCRGPWHPDRLQSSVQAAVDRHPMLRSSFHLSLFSEPLQIVHREVQASLHVVDLRSDPGTLESRLDGWLEAEKRLSLVWREPPLVRFFALRLEGDLFAVAFSFFDAVLDGWSAASLAEEVLGSFARRLRGDAEPLPALESTYRKFIQLERAALASETSREFWRSRLATVASSPLPGWRQGKSPVKTRLGRVGISVGWLGDLESLAEQAGVPLKSVFLAAHLLVLERHQAAPGALTGIESSGRPETRDGERVLGMHVNILPLSLRPGGETTVEWVQRTYGEEVDVAQHRRFPFSEMARLRDRQDLIDTVFNYTRFHILGKMEKLGVPEVLGATVFNRSSFVLRVDVSVHPSGSHAELTLGADRRQIGEAQLDALAIAYRRTLAVLGSGSSRKVSEFEVLSDAQRHQILREWNDSPGPQPYEGLLQDGFEASVLRTPKAPAVEINGAAVSYEELDRLASRLSSHLHALGVGSEDVVVLAVERSLDLLIAVLGVLKAGAAYLPLNARDPRKRQEMLLEAARPKALVVGRWPGGAPSFGGLVIDLEEGFGTFAVSSTRPSSTWPRRPSSKSLAYLLFTSGSSGRPKGVGVSHGAAANLLQSLQALLRPEPGFRFLALTPLSFDISVLELFLTWQCGGTVVFTADHEGEDGAALLRCLQGSRIDWMQATPTTWKMLISCAWTGTKALKILSGGEALTSGLACQLIERGDEVWNLYGPTETTVWSAAERLVGGASLVGLQGQALESTSFGRPIGNTHCFVLDPTLRPTPNVVEGELYIAGAGLSRGYWREPAQTAAVFLPNPHGRGPGARMYRSGDRVCRMPDGRMVFLGRLDEQLKVRGHRVEPAEIVKRLEQHPSVEQAVVVASEVTPGQRGLVAYIVAAPGSQVVSQVLRSWLSSRLPPSMMPSIFVTVPTIPRTPHGKVDKRCLPSPLKMRPSGERIGSLLDQLEALSDEETEKLLMAEVQSRS